MQRVTGHPDGSDRWNFELAEKRTAAIRVEALWTELPAENAVTLISPDDMDSLSLYSPTTRVSFALAAIRQLGLNIPLLFVMNALFGMKGIVWTQVTADIINVMVSYVIYHAVCGKIFSAGSETR